MENLSFLKTFTVAFTRGLYNKYRLKRRIPFSCCSRKFTKVPQFYMGREVLPIQSSPIRPVFGSEDIHETVKTGCCLPKKERHPSAYLSGRFSSPGSNKGRSNQKYSNVSSTPAVPRFHSKPQEILTNSNTNDYLPGFQHRFKVIDNCTSSNKGPEDYGMLPEPDNSTNSHIAKRSKPDRPSGILSASHLAFSPSFSPLADGSDRGPTDESGMLRLTDSPFTGLQERTRLVAGKYSQYKQQPCAPASSRPSNYNRRFEERLGRSAPVIEDQRQMVRTRITPTHQLLGVESSLPSSEVVSQRQISLDRVSKVRQHNSYCVHKQQRGNTFTPTPNLSSGVVGLVSNKRHLSDSHSCPRKRRCLCRHGIENIQGHERLEVESHHNPTISAGLPDRSVRKSPDHPTEELHQLEARSRGHPHRCLNNTLGSSEGICISTVQSDIQNSREGHEGVSFKLTTPRKSGSADKPAEAFFARFDQDKRLCPVECLRQYLKSTRDIRPVIPSSQPDRLFISFIRPHKPVTSTTLGRWLRNFMKAAGIDSQIFKAHSVRGASTTAAANAFVPLSTIMAMADWSSSSTFRTFYYKPLFNSDFATGVLSSK